MLFAALCQDNSAKLQSFEGRNGGRHRQDAFWGIFAVLDGVNKHFDGLTGVGRNKNGGGEQTAANPGLPGLRQTIASEERELEPALPVSVIEIGRASCRERV